MTRCPIHGTKHDGKCPKCEAKRHHRQSVAAGLRCRQDIVYPGTYFALCRTCGGWRAWCTHDAPSSGVYDWQEKYRRECRIVSVEFGDVAPAPKCECQEAV